MTARVPKLTIELIPSTAWGKNVRSVVSEKDWQQIRTSIYRRANYRCEVCGSDRTGLQCHEVWEFIDTTNGRHIQKLVGLVCLCVPCHQVKHFGRTTSVGREREARKHLARVNSWTPRQVEQHIRESLLLWNARCTVEWELDLSYIQNTTVTP